MADVRLVYQPAFYHIPAQESLESTHYKKDEGLVNSRSAQLFPYQEIDEGNDKDQADRPAQNPVEPLPEVNRLEILQGEVIVELLKFWILLVKLESFLPFGFV